MLYQNEVKYYKDQNKVVSLIEETSANISFEQLSEKDYGRRYVSPVYKHLSYTKDTLLIIRLS